jgi:lysophospholipase L1-like esterase
MRKMGDVIEELDGGVTTMTILLGRRTSLVRSAYMSRLVAAQGFTPDIVIAHCGHNDIVAHSVHNPNPTHILPYFGELQSFWHVLEGNHPTSRVYISSLLPRAPGYSFSTAQKIAYNKLAIRFMEMMRSDTRDLGYGVLYNKVLFKSIRKWEEKSEYYLADGLHLNKAGKKEMAREWLATLGHGISID